ncbi:unnamed protein product [Cylicocyclus nassatus]|uniref:G-protein coupled receptors family 1 profile domain-containing protein n=1 Tax=Cylicocyclus nassatus TaxID=53992 RepID=A0AA36MC24_CYLNA|nr:unnamed protein product [Cylicocyclus nassatus]
MSNSSDEFYDECLYQPQIFLEWKMCFVGCLGLATALISVIHNSLLFYTFVFSKVLRKRHLTYLMWISGCDIFVSISYIAIMCVQVYIDYFESLTLFFLWHHYLRAAFTISHITISTVSFLLMAATIERYLHSTSDSKTGGLFYLLSRHRAPVVVICFAASCVFRGTIFFEVKLQHVSQCEGFSSMSLASSRLFANPLYDEIWRFWIRKIVTVIVPFVALAWFNLAIVLNVRKSDRDQTVKALVMFTTVGTRAEVTKLRSRLRTVTRMLVMVVCCYLAANIIDVVIAFWETIDMDSLNANEGFYAVTTDISSFLPILACSMRPPIYVINDKQIRSEVFRKVRDLQNRFCSCCPLIGRALRLQKKFHEVEHENEKLVIASPQPKISTNSTEPSFSHGGGIGALIMARCSLATSEQRRQLKQFGESVDV